MENTSLCGFSAGLHCKNRPVAVSGIPVSCRLQPNLLNLNPLDFDTRHVLQANAQAKPHANFAALRLSVIAEWDLLAAVQICKTSVFSGERVNADDF
jgi:hypothetical protein